MLEQYFINVLKKKYADFSGRASRTEFWYYVLFNFLIIIGLSALSYVHDLLSILIFVYFLATFIPTLAINVRRLHDTGRSGWWYFIVLIPFFGLIIYLAFTVTDSEPTSNKYGPNPHTGEWDFDITDNLID